MDRVNVLTSIKNEIDNHIGEEVTLKANNGRRKIVVSNGIIEKTYPSIFVVRLGSDTPRTVTYSYSDVLTKAVQIEFAG
ncbi:Veg family protein [Clostridium sp. DL1XJH146]